ncbi:MAG TPA: 4-hydroxyproline epimerase [Bacteroidota bacterium]|nr:4-hydroxyproline epimerase [Bacteroidota bacterium]
MASRTFFCIDAHTCGNPVRVVVGGGPQLEGANMSERRQDFLRRYDWIRTGLMFEPRGHDMMSGSILYPPTRDDTDIGILFIETSGCLPMCGHGTIGTVTVMIEHGLVTPKTPGRLRLEVPAGIVEAYYAMEGKKVKSVRIVNVPSFLHSTNLEVECPELGMLRVDVAYGGNFYAIVDPQEKFRGLEYITAADVLRWSPVVRKRINERYSFVHPENPTIRGCSHVMWTGKPKHPEATARNAVFYGDKAIDRSPCGTGTSARLAQLAAKGCPPLGLPQWKEGDVFVHESIIGSLFRARIEKRTRVGEYEAIIPSVEGWAKIYGFNTITIDEDDDPFAHGFQVV